MTELNYNYDDELGSHGVTSPHGLPFDDIYVQGSHEVTSPHGPYEFDDIHFQQIYCEGYTNPMVLHMGQTDVVMKYDILSSSYKVDKVDLHSPQDKLEYITFDYNEYFSDFEELTGNDLLKLSCNEQSSKRKFSRMRVYPRYYEEGLYFLVTKGFNQGVYQALRLDSSLYYVTKVPLSTFMFQYRHLLVQGIVSNFVPSNHYKRDQRQKRRKFLKKWKAKFRPVLVSLKLLLPRVIKPFNNCYSQCGFESEKEYSRSKTRFRRKNFKQTQTKLKKVAEDLDNANLGSRKKYTKKKFAKKCKTSHCHIKQQSGFFQSCTGSDDTVKLTVTAIEKAFALFSLMYADKPIYKALSAGLLMFQGSLTTSAIELVKDCFNMWKGKDVKLQDFTTWLKSCCTDFEGFKKNKYASSFVEFITKATSFIMCPSIATYWDSFKANTIVAKIFSFFENINSPFEGLINSFTYIVNAIDVFVRTGSMDGFIHTEMTGDVLLEELRRLRCDFQLFKTGDLDFIKGYGDYKFLHDLDSLQKSLQNYKKTRKGPEIRVVEEWLREVDKMQTFCQQTNAKTAFRIQPYLFMLASGSGISKSHLTRLAVETIARANDIPSGAEYTFYLNQSNKFQSGYRNCITIIIADDSACCIQGKDGGNNLNMGEWTLRSSNNSPHELLGADTSEKGVLFNRSLIQAYTTNSWDQAFHATMRFPSAVNRRFQCRISARVRPAFTKTVTYDDGISTQIDYDKLSEDERIQIAPDAWLFDIYDVEIKDQGLRIKKDFTPVGEELDNDFRYVPMIFKGKKMLDLSLGELLAFLIEHSKSHYNRQKAVLDMNAKVLDTQHYCQHGMPRCTSQHCKHCNNDAAKIQRAFKTMMRSKTKRKVRVEPYVEKTHLREKVNKILHKTAYKTVETPVCGHLVPGVPSSVHRKGKSPPKTYFDTAYEKALSRLQDDATMLSGIDGVLRRKKVAGPEFRPYRESVDASRRQLNAEENKAIAATVVQSLWRSYSVRKQLRVRPIVEVDIGDLHNVLLRKNYFGPTFVPYKESLNTHRKHVNLNENKNVATTCIQSSWRGYVHRKKMEKQRVVAEFKLNPYAKPFVSTAYALPVCLKQGGVVEDGTVLFEATRRNEHSTRIIAMNQLIQTLKERSVLDIFQRLKNVKDSLKMLNEVRKALINTLETWFEEFVCDVLCHFIDKAINYVHNFLQSPTYFIPTYFEDTDLGAYAYAKHPLLRLPLFLDYAGYRCQFQLAAMTSNPIAQHIPQTTPITDHFYNTYIRSLTKFEIKERAKWIPASMATFALGAGRRYSKAERLIKSQAPDLFRDVFVPVVGSGLIVSKFIPDLCRKIKSMYCEMQVGYDVSVEDIGKLDKQEVDKFYLNKKEIFVTPPDVEGHLNHTDLEALLLKNTLYCKNSSTNEFCTAFSPMNKYVIMPKHFVKNAMNTEVIFTKKLVPSLKVPGNGLINMVITEEICYHLDGDITIVYLEKHMDHQRTRDLLCYFPNERHSTDSMVGSVLYKSKLGVSNKINATHITFSRNCNNENLGVFDEPENKFVGYYYKCDNFAGLCGGILLDETHKKSQILGFHVGGNVKTKDSVAQAVLRSDINNAIKKFEPYGIVKQIGINLDGYDVSVPIKEPYIKNPFFDTVDRLDGVELFGSIEKRVTPKSRVVYTPICDDVITEFKLTTKWGPPPFRFDGDKRYGIRSLIKQYATRQTLRRPDLLKLAEEDYRKALMTPLENNPKYWSQELRVLNDYEVVNGVVGKRYLGGMNMASSFDHRKPGPKSRYAVQAPDGHWDFEPFVMQEYHTRLDQMKKGIITNEIYVQCLKNEATPETKIAKGKVRSFYMSGTVTQMIIRKYLLTTCRYYCLNTPYSETMVGINPHDLSWDKFCNEFYAKGKDFMMALDFKSFDITSLFEVVSSSIKTLMMPLRRAMEIRNCPSSEIEEVNNVLNCIAHLLLYSMLIVGGEVVVMQAIIASGSNLTSMLGSTVNSINYRMAFYHIFGAIETAFRDAVTLRTFGDDSLANTTKEYSKFSAKNVLKSWQYLGIPATCIDKTDTTSKEFYRQNELEFLKRKMVYHKDFKCHIAPLDLNSMFKCLCCHVPPRTVDIKVITGQCVDNFMFEARYHGRKFYNRARTKLYGMLKKHDLLKYSNAIDITYDDQIALWRTLYSKEQVTNPSQPDFKARVRHFLDRFISPEPWSLTTQSTISEYTMVQDHSHLKVGDVPDSTRLIKQSGTEVVDQQEQVVTFVDAETSNSLMVGTSLPPSRVHDTEVSISDYLSRPIRIATIDWNKSGYGPRDFDPWYTLLQTPRISNKIATYSLFRAKCKLKFVINGNGFFYGRLMVYYLPYAKIDTTTYATTLDIESSKTISTQCPHIFLDPTTSTGAEMTLPWFYHAEYLDLTQQNDQNSLGKIFIDSMGQLKHVNRDIATTQDIVSISVYAWFEDVDLQGATRENPTGISAQSGREDETHNKPVSQFCTAVADASAHISNIPVIGPYAKAVEQGARVGSTVASALGYCKPLDAAENTKVIPRNTNSMALTNTVDDCNKLSVDVKQELSIDPRLVGLSGVDELSIQRIASIKSYIDHFMWAFNSIPNTLLFSARVCPYHYQVTPETNYALTAMMGSAMHFEYWTGSIDFHFQVVSSAFHRGRLLISYEPAGGNTPPEEVANYTWVVDIAETRDFKVSISNYQKYDWIRINDELIAEERQSSSSPTALTKKSFDNGILTVHVLNALTVPTFDAALNTDIRVNVFASAGNDFRVAVPRHARLVPQSGTETPDVIGEESPTVMTTPSNTLRNYKSSKYIGEEIESFRTLLKRYNFYGTWMLDRSPSSNVGFWIDHQHFPLGAMTFQPETHRETTLMYFLMKAFSGYRGAVRWKFNVGGNNNSGTLIHAGREEVNTDFAAYMYDSNNSTVWMSEKASKLGRMYGNGATLVSKEVNNVLSVELPFYSQYAFVPAKITSFTDYYEEYNPFGWRLFAMQTPLEFDRTLQYEERYYLWSVDMWVAAGEDFTCFFFTGWPVVVSLVGG